MATHSSNLAWEIPWTEEPGGRQSMGPQKSQLSNNRIKLDKAFTFLNEIIHNHALQETSLF